MSSLIIRFDTKTEMFTEIATPPGECFYMTVVGGCIHLCMFPEIDSDRLELWKMDGDGEWVKVIRSCRSLFDDQPFHLMKNGNWLLCSIRNVIVLNVHRKEEKSKIACVHTIDGTMVILSRGKFVETIVSLKR
ncbi:hypothetical protein L6452_08102 [Arctium lappa]|uniref:Uncharacterized protein n=1 Tax=Arctium lappa TaxID=4217 RepID=A0ACB9DGN1_ARCLA|nr:hypothetical protein L6452_08102 [Arctium lappa]